MQVGDWVHVLDDGKHNRKVNGKVVAVVDEVTVVVSHILWGYGDDQLPVNHLYRKDHLSSGWCSVNDLYKTIDGNYISLESVGCEWSCIYEGQ